MKYVAVMMVGLVVGLPGAAVARDTRLLLPIQKVLTMPRATERLDPNFHFFFGGAKGPEGEARGEVISNSKTNASNKSDEEACEWAMLSALVELQERAKRVGGNAVVAVQSYYKKVPFTSDTEYECHAGAIVAGVAFRGQAVKVP